MALHSTPRGRVGLAVAAFGASALLLAGCAGGSTGGSTDGAASGDPIEFFMSESQFEYWKYTHLTIDVVPGRGAGFSVESPTGNRFIIRSRMLDDAELEAFGLRPGI